jgi:hypothetical protein
MLFPSPPDFQVILLKNYAPQHLILMPAFRSPDTTRLCLFNNSLLGAAAGTDQQQGGMDAQQQQQQFGSFAAFKAANIMPRVLDEIVWPMRQLEVGWRCTKWGAVRVEHVVRENEKLNALNIF